MLLEIGLCIPAGAREPVVWARKRLPSTCEPPYVFYSARHVPGRVPCCPAAERVCSGGGACPPEGVCASDGRVCTPESPVVRPNVLLFVSDDQGHCFYGSADECRSTQSGTPLPPPLTPNLDVLAGYGTTFPIAHNTASWCFPSLASILTGRYQRSFGGQRRVNDAAFTTLPGALRRLDGDPGVPPDPYNAGNGIGGYCTLLAGKFTGALDTTSFDAVAKTNGRRLGRNECVAGPASEPPLCGTAGIGPYAPFTTGRMTDVFNFIDMLVHRPSDAASETFRVQPFFVWYAPRVPHQPLRSPAPVLVHLFGGTGAASLGGAMNLGRWCAGGTCAPVVSAFAEDNFGSVREYYGNLWWADDNIRELRRFLAEETAPHCIAGDGRSRFDLVTPTACTDAGGAWAGVSPDLERNTVFIHLSDNGWHLPRSKHAFTENGYRTRIVVYDPRALTAPPSWDPEVAPVLPARTVDALAHGIDVLPTALGFALGTSGSQACPVGPDGRRCDGKDLGAHLVTSPGGPAAPETLRHALCGHQTKRPTSPTRDRYLLTRPGSVGRCARTVSPACASAADCPAGEFCLAGRCTMDASESACAGGSQCPAGSTCLGGRCRVGPACLDDTDCDALVGPGYECGAKHERWCRNAPNVSCATSTDCPACPAVAGNPVPCGRVCEARSLKLYVSPGSSVTAQLSDLFLDPDESGLHDGRASTSLVATMSAPSGPYAGVIRRLSCCIDQWWPEIVGESGTLCPAGATCPADLVCDG